MGLSLHDVLRIRPDVMFRQLADEAVLLDLRSGTYFGLNEVGSRIWQLIGERQPLASVLDALAEEYAVERGALSRDLLDLGEQLRSRGLVDVAKDET